MLSTVGMRRSEDEVRDAPGRAVIAQRQLHVLTAMRIDALAQEREAGFGGDLRLVGRGKHRLVLTPGETSAKLAVVLKCVFWT